MNSVSDDVASCSPRTAVGADPPLRVMHVITGLGQGGAEAMLVNLTTACAGLGVEQRVVSLLSGGANAAHLRAAGIPVDHLAMTPGRPSLRGVLRLSGLIRRHRPQVIQSWMYHADLAAWAARALLPARLRPRLVWGIRCSDMRMDHYGRQLRWVIGAGARLSRRPDMIVANSQAGADVHRALGYRNDRFVVIPNGIDTGRFRPDPSLRASGRAALGLAEDVVAIAMVARVDAMKDHRTFLAAMARCPDLRAVLIGRGTDALDLPPNVTALGARSDIDRLLPAFDVIALSSAFGEGFPNALAEGMAAGLVPVATDVGDTRRIVGEAGHVVPSGDPVRLAGALLRAAADVRAGRGAAARCRIVENFDLDRAASAFRTAYVDLLRPASVVR